MPTADAPKVFISYSWTTEEHKKWVEALATRLIGDGVDVILDVWDLKDGHDTIAFMEKIKTDKEIKKVLVVCDSGYAKKADKRAGGVGTEAQIISPDVYNAVGQERFIPVVRERDEHGKACLPVFMASRLYIDFTNEDEFEDKYDRLLRNIHNKPELKKPPLGNPPAYLTQPDATAVKTIGHFNRLRDAVQKDRPHKEVIFRDYLETLSASLEEFRITEADATKGEADDLIVQRIGQMAPYRDQFIEFCNLYATYSDNDTSYFEVHSFLERLLRLYQGSESMQRWSKWYFEPHQFVGYEWVLYLLSTLIHHRKYQTATRFMDDVYQYPTDGFGRTANTSLSIFCYHMPVLEEQRPARLQQNVAVVPNMIREAAKHPRITFDSLLQTDLVLLLRPVILDPNGSVWWYSRLAGRSRVSGPLDIFARANTPKGQTAIRDLFGAKDARDLARRVAMAFKNESLRQYFTADRFRFGYSLEQSLNWDELKHLLA